MEMDVRGSNESSFFVTEPIGKLMMKFAIPAIISMLVNSLYNIVDQIFIGRAVGPLGNAATNVCFPFVTISLALSLLISDGGVAYFSLMLGEKKQDRADKAVGTAIVLSAIFGVALLLVGKFAISDLLKFFGATSESFPYAFSYGQITLLGMPFVSVSMIASSIIRADGRPKYAMICMVAGALVNVVLDALFVFVFHWGVAGAAWATVIGQVLNFALAIYGLRDLRNTRLSLKSLKLDFKSVPKILSLGTSSFVTQAAGTVVVILMNRLLVQYGALTEFGPDIPMAAFGIVMKANQVVFSIMLGIGIGSQPIEGYNYGAKNYSRVKETYIKSIVAALTVGVIGWACIQLFTQQIINIFGSGDALYNEFARLCFKTYLMLIFLAGFSAVSGIFFQAIGKPGKAMMISLSRQVVFFIPCLLILTNRYGLMGMLYTGPVTDVLALLFTGTLVIMEMKTFRGLIKTELAPSGA